MKNIFVYYLLITIPLVVLLLLKREEMINSNGFALGLAGYAILYGTYTDGKRLADKGIISETNIWKMIIPGQRFRYFRDLYTR